MPDRRHNKDQQKHFDSRSRSPSVSNRRAESPGRRSYHGHNNSDGWSDKKRRHHRSLSPPDQRQYSQSSRDRHSESKKMSSNDQAHHRSRRHDSPDNSRRSHRKRSYSRSPDSRRRRSYHEDNSRTARHRHESRSSPSTSPPRGLKRSVAPLPSQKSAFATESNIPSASKGDPPKEKQKPTYTPSGLLAAETNTVANTGIVLKYNEPPESRLPPASQPWRLYVFKSSDVLDTIQLHTRTCWLFGRESQVVDVPIEHPSCSKQHAVLQFRYVEKSAGEYGERKGGVGLYLIDLESANGTTLNGESVPKRRFVECRNGDMIKFGESTREYVVLLPPKE